MPNALVAGAPVAPPGPAAAGVVMSCTARSSRCLLCLWVGAGSGVDVVGWERERRGGWESFGAPTQSTPSKPASKPMKAAHHWHCLWCTRPLHAKFACPPDIFETLGCRHICWREPSTVVRTLVFEVVSAGVGSGCHYECFMVLIGCTVLMRCGRLFSGLSPATFGRPCAASVFKPPNPPPHL